jgi:hypothetical protein
MTDRDELADLIREQITHDTSNRWTMNLVDAILARWRLVPVDSAPYVEPDASTIDCPACGRHAGQPCFEVIDIGNGVDLGPYDLNPGQYHHARQNAANLKATQHRAADELTRHDQAAGIYDAQWTELDVIHSQPPPYPAHQHPMPKMRLTYSPCSDASGSYAATAARKANQSIRPESSRKSS